MVFTWLHLGIIIFLSFGLLMGAGPLIGSLLLAPKAKGGDHGMSYECGMRPHGSSWGKMGITYYIYALLFLAFDVDILYLFPVAVYYPAAEGLMAFVKVFIFLFIIAMAVAYFWAKGVFTWPRRIS